MAGRGGGKAEQIVDAGGNFERALVTVAHDPLDPLGVGEAAAHDPRHGLKVLAFADELIRAGGTVILSLHDLRTAYYLDHVIVLAQGGLRAAGRPHDVLTPELLQEVFGVKAEFVSSLVLRLR